MRAPEIQAAIDRQDPGNLGRAFDTTEDGIVAIGRALGECLGSAHTVGGVCLMWWQHHGTTDPFVLASLAEGELGLRSRDRVDAAPETLAGLARIIVTAELGHVDGGWFPELDWPALMREALA